MNDDEMNESCYRHLREVMRAQVATLEAAGRDHLKYVDDARNCIARIDARVDRAPVGRQAKATVLRLVTTATSGAA